MTTRIMFGIAALLAAVALPAMGQDTSANPSLGLESSAVGGGNAGPLDAQITGDNTYGSLIAAINANESVDLSGVTADSKLSIVMVSTLQGDAATEGAALDAAVGARADMLTTLRSNAGANAVITGKLLVEGFTTDDILAIRTDASGNTLIYVDDR